MATQRRWRGSSTFAPPATNAMRTRTRPAKSTRMCTIRPTPNSHGLSFGLILMAATATIARDSGHRQAFSPPVLLRRTRIGSVVSSSWPPLTPLTPPQPPPPSCLPYSGVSFQPHSRLHRLDSRSQRGNPRVVPTGRYATAKFNKKEETPDALPSDLSNAMSRHSSPLTQAAAIYRSYLRRLWEETDPVNRRRNARDEVNDAIKKVESLLTPSVAMGQGQGFVAEDGAESGDEDEDTRSRRAESKDARNKLLEACETLRNVMKREEEAEAKIVPTASAAAAAAAAAAAEASLPPVSLFRDEDELASAAELAADAAVSTAPPPELLSAQSAAAAAAAVAAPDAAALEMDNGGEKATKEKKKEKKSRRSILFGATMGALCAGWVFSGNLVFTSLFAAFTVLAQLEYYRMCMGARVYPARRISIVGAVSMYVAALFAPELHQIVLPAFGTAAMIWFLTMRRRVSTLPEIATTFTGMFYLGYIPSFWVRLRLLGGGREPTRLAPILSPLLEYLGRTAESLPRWVPTAIQLPITKGAVFIFWSWLCIAFSDVGAYFVGRSFGKTKLGTIAPAAGATSPNKTVEGFLGGCAVSAALATLGAWVQRWPYWYVTGPLHGLYLGLLGLIGDLTASMLKRDAGLKDFGDLIPEHGGIMDRVDSYIFTAPYSFLVCGYILPWLARIAGARAAIPAM